MCRAAASSAKFFILNAKFLGFDTPFLVFDTHLLTALGRLLDRVVHHPRIGIKVVIDLLLEAERLEVDVRLHLIPGCKLSVKSVAKIAPRHRAQDDEVVGDGLGRVAVSTCIAGLTAAAGAVIHEVGAAVCSRPRYM